MKIWSGLFTWGMYFCGWNATLIRGEVSPGRNDPSNNESWKVHVGFIRIQEHHTGQDCRSKVWRNLNYRPRNTQAVFHHLTLLETQLKHDWTLLTYASTSSGICNKYVCCVSYSDKGTQDRLGYLYCKIELWNIQWFICHNDNQETCWLLRWTRKLYHHAFLSSEFTIYSWPQVSGVPESSWIKVFCISIAKFIPGLRSLVHLKLVEACFVGLLIFCQFGQCTCNIV